MLMRICAGAAGQLCVAAAARCLSCSRWSGSEEEKSFKKYFAYTLSVGVQWLTNCCTNCESTERFSHANIPNVDYLQAACIM